MKFCKRCCNNLPLENFSINNRASDGKQNTCKMCVNTKYKKDFKEFAAKLYRAQVKNSLKRGHKPPTYDKKGFTKWLLSQECFYLLHTDWKDSGYEIGKVPSCDRIDDYKGYSFDNIRLVTWSENNSKAKEDVKNGVNNKKSKGVDCYTLKGDFFASYPSAEYAARVVKGQSKSIRGVCNKKAVKKGYNKQGEPRYSIPNHAYDYVWKWSNN